ncbi:uncharacterized protein LDX57_011121 [Aspergillus melleus]|uniref:uncharacterized protein n=1 Tax=Aspergillus melleus TaxID=138277 RepID=UPI001E8D91B9|nr:uncharacterized protein LDX57_011121 [Aspergillus melleus]KAH8433487.1 hypothetical protein LDX57_011121 [Aspergillus melleus]
MSTPLDIQTTISEGTALANMFYESVPHNHLIHETYWPGHVQPTDAVVPYLTDHFNQIITHDYRPADAKDVLMKANLPGEPSKIVAFAY